MKFLTFEDILIIHKWIVTDFQSISGHDQGQFFTSLNSNLINENSLHYVIQEIQGGVGFNIDPCPTLFEKAAKLAWRIIRGHVFNDGNKRTGMVCCFVFLAYNDYQLHVDDEFTQMAIDIASNNVEYTKFLDWLKTKITKGILE